jgi:predicted permease
MSLKLALRTLFAAPFVTLVAILSLALGIGSTSAIYSLFDQVLLRALPVQEPERLVNLGAPGPKPGSQSCNTAGDCDEVFSYPMFRDLERQQTVFTGIAGHRAFSANLSWRGQTLNGDGMLVSGSYFPVLGLQPALGRLLGPDDDRVVGESAVVVLSHAYWRTRFAGDPAILNDTLVINGHPMTIVGVAPAGFEGTTLGIVPQVFVPVTLRGVVQPGFADFDNRRAYWVYLFARLRPGVSLEQARAGINVPYRSLVNDVEVPLQTGLSDQTLARFRAKEITVAPGVRGQSAVHQEARGPLVLLAGVTAFVLLIACANIANLLLARSAARAGEMAIRLSIGASRWQLVRQLLFESCVLAAFGGIAGLLVAHWTLALVGSMLPGEAAGWLRFEIDRTVLLSTAALVLGTGLLFGLFPAWHSTRPDLVTTLKGQAGQPAGGRAAARFRTTLATVQIAISMALLVSAGLFARSLYNVSRVDLGLRVDDIVTFRISPELNGYTPEASKALFERLEDELAAQPGVTAVSTSMVPLLSGSNWGSNLTVEGFPAGPDTDTHAMFNLVGPGYFRTLGVPLVTGREFTRADAAGAPKVAIVNEQFVKKFDLGRNALGRHIAVGRGERPDIEIVGVVRNAKYSEVKAPVPPQYFRPYRQDEQVGAMSFYVRTSLPPEQLLPLVPRVVARLDANLPVVDLRTMRAQVRENVFLDRFVTVLSAAFAGLATLLAAVGLYGVLAYTVAQRTREIGLRMALGADPARVRGMVLGQVARMTAIGGTIGLAAAIGVGQLARSMLYGLEGHDPLAAAAAAAALVCVAFGAGLVPALRASQVDPIGALRYE